MNQHTVLPDRSANLVAALGTALADAQARACGSLGIHPSDAAAVITLGYYPGKTVSALAPIIGFTPSAVLIDDQTVHDTLEAGRIAAQAMIDQHPGGHEVAIVRSSAGGLLYWSGNDDGVIDSVVWSSGYPSDIDGFV